MRLGIEGDEYVLEVMQKLLNLKGEKYVSR